MHSDTKLIKVFAFGDADFINSLKELKEYFKFNLELDENNESSKKFSKYDVLLVHQNFKNFNKLNNIKILVFEGKNNKNKHTPSLKLPTSIYEINKKITDLIVKNKFLFNSSINIKDYLLDKNEKKLKKDGNFIIITEKEIQLLELFLSKKTPLTKNEIQKKVWHYADDTETHTVETHIYRLRKKILKNFLDDDFIISKNNGYQIK